MGRKITVWIIQTTIWRGCTKESIDLAKNGKFKEKN